jgi:ATP-dependent Lon protease
MTGEITLRGLVLPVGGIKEKVLAAVRAGTKEVILPERCRNDLDDVPEHTRKKLKVHFVSRMEEVLEIALGIPLQLKLTARKRGGRRKRSGSRRQ